MEEKMKYNNDKQNDDTNQRQSRPLTMTKKFLNPKNHTENYKRSLDNKKEKYMNFSNGLAANVLKTLVQTEQQQKARKDILKDKEHGLTEAERLKKITKMSAGKYVTISQSHWLGKSLWDKLQFDRDEMKRKNDEKAKEDMNAYKKLCVKADMVLKEKVGVHPSSWSINELKDVIRPLKEKGKERITGQG